MSVYRVRNFNLFIYLIKKPVSEYRHFYNTLVHFACYVEQINKTNIFRWLFRDIIFVWFCHSLCNISYVVFHLTWKLRHMGFSQVMWIYFVIQFIIKLLKKIMKQKVFNILLFTKYCIVHNSIKAMWIGIQWDSGSDGKVGIWKSNFLSLTLLQEEVPSGWFSNP